MVEPTTTAIERVLREAWDLRPEAVRPHDTGMNSRTWTVVADGRRYIAKAVPEAARRTFVGGLTVAARLETAGVRAGGPVATVSGAFVHAHRGQVVALLAFADGDELTGGSETDRALIGATLASVHRALRAIDPADLGVEPDVFPWLDPAAPHLDVEPWVRPAIVEALEAYAAIDPATLTMHLLHSDPAPEAFRHDAASATTAVIDWDRALVGPAMYDVASAVMYVGGVERAGPLVDAYVAADGLTRAEVDRALPTMRRLRWAVQADYFAGRIATDDRTGIADPAANATGLEDARRALD